MRAFKRTVLYRVPRDEAVVSLAFSTAAVTGVTTHTAGSGKRICIQYCSIQYVQWPVMTHEPKVAHLPLRWWSPFNNVVPSSQARLSLWGGCNPMVRYAVVRSAGGLLGLALGLGLPGTSSGSGSGSGGPGTWFAAGTASGAVHLFDVSGRQVQGRPYAKTLEGKLTTRLLMPRLEAMGDPRALHVYPIMAKQSNQAPASSCVAACIMEWVLAVLLLYCMLVGCMEGFLVHPALAERQAFGCILMACPGAAP